MLKGCPTQLPTLPIIQGCFLNPSSPTVLMPTRKEKRERIKAHTCTIPQHCVHLVLSSNYIHRQTFLDSQCGELRRHQLLLPHTHQPESQKRTRSSQCLSRYCKIITLSELNKQTNFLPQDVVKGEKTLVLLTCM